MKFVIHIVLSLISLAFNKSNAQLTPTLIDVKGDSFKLDASEVIFKKTFEGKIASSIDSSVYKKFDSDKLEYKKISLESKNLKNIGYGKKIQTNLNPKPFNSPKSKPFEGFEMVDNASYALSKIPVEEGLTHNNI